MGGKKMKIAKVIFVLLLPFILFITTAFILIAIKSDQNNSDVVVVTLNVGFMFVVMLICVSSSIIIVFLYLILNELKKFNLRKIDDEMNDIYNCKD